MPAKYTFDIEIVQSTVRLSSHDGPEHPDYGEPQEVTLRVTRRREPIRSGNRRYPANYIVNVSIVDLEWAEYSQVDWDAEHNEFMAEQYRMWIVGGWIPIIP